MSRLGKLKLTGRAPEDRAIIGLILWLAATFSAAAIGAAFRPGAWYGQLAKPSWTPPSWLFGPVWTALYAAMAIAAWLVWKRAGFQQHRFALRLFIGQLILNAIWSPLCFGLHSLALSSLDIVLLWVVLLATIVAFFRVNRVSAWLLVPYQIWITYAAALNIALWRMN